MARKRIDDSFSKFYDWMISEQMSENTAKIYSSTARSIERTALAEGKEVEAFLGEGDKPGVFRTAWKAYNKFLQSGSPEVVEDEVVVDFPEEVRLAKIVIEKYNATSHHKVIIHG